MEHISNHYHPTCIICKAEFSIHGCGSKAGTCSSKCRQQAYRNRKERARILGIRPDSDKANLLKWYPG